MFTTINATRKSTLVEKAGDERNRRWSEWLQRIAEGDLDAFSALYDDSSPVLFGLVLQIIPDRQLAEDALIDLYHHARKQAAGFAAGKQQAVDWLITLARDFTADRARRTDAVTPNRPGDSFADERRLASIAAAQLSEEQRSVLEMVYLGGLNAAEVAQVLGTSREYAAKQIVFGMKRLKMCSENLAGATIRIQRFG